jgi:hypothetical protein
MELLNEAVIYYASLHLLLFTDFIPETETSYLCGYSMVGFVSLGLMINMGKILKEIFY